MKILITFLCLFLSIFESKSQNLIPNPDFEDTLYCPGGPAGFAKNWSSCLGSPDYFNSCAPSCLPPQTCVGVPNNWAGTQSAYSGGAYSGLVTFGYGGLTREILITELIETLDIGKKYYFSCYISRAFIGGTHGASNNFGFRFSTVEFDPFNEVPIDNFSHYRDTVIVTDTTNWTRIEGSIIADSSYRFLMLGNFYDDSNTDTIDMNPTTAPWNYAYYYLDDICVTPDSGNCTLINSVNPNTSSINFNISPNPFNDRIKIQSTSNVEFEFSVYNLLGQEIYSEKNYKYDEFNLENLEAGIYLYVIKNKNAILKNGKIIKQ